MITIMADEAVLGVGNTLPSSRGKMLAQYDTTIVGKESDHEKRVEMINDGLAVGKRRKRKRKQ